MVTHYTRLAPLRAITSDFKRSLQSQADKTKKDKDNVTMTRTMKKLSDQLAQYTVELDELKKQIKILDKRPLARCYAVNPRTKVTHRVLTSYEYAGIHAKTICKRPYIQAWGFLNCGGADYEKHDL